MSPTMNLRSSSTDEDENPRHQRDDPVDREIDPHLMGGCSKGEYPALIPRLNTCRPHQGQSIRKVLRLVRGVCLTVFLLERLGRLGLLGRFRPGVFRLLRGSLHSGLPSPLRSLHIFTFAGLYAQRSPLT